MKGIGFLLLGAVCVLMIFLLGTALVGKWTRDAPLPAGCEKLATGIVECHPPLRR